MSPKLRFADERPGVVAAHCSQELSKRSFADKCVPKLELGHELGKGAIPACSVNRRPLPATDRPLK